NLTGNITLNYTGPGDTNWALQDNAGNTSAQYAPEDINDGVTTQCGGGWGDCFGGCSPYPCIAVNITLEKPWVINKIRTFWWDPDNDEEYDRHYNYYINVSLDGTNWTMIVDRRDNDTTWDGGYPDAVYEEVDEFQPILAKYVMIVGTYNSANTGIHLIEAEVYSVAYEQQGTYISDWIDTGKNLTKFALNAQTQNTENGNITYWFRSNGTNGLSEWYSDIKSVPTNRYIQFKARLQTYDLNYTPSLESLKVYEGSKIIGWSLTDSGGVATKDYTLSPAAILGEHIINCTYPGSSELYTLYSQNSTSIQVQDKPQIQNIQATPDPSGYGLNVTISANVTDSEGIDTVKITIVYPNGSTVNDVMTNASSSYYEYNFTDTWLLGVYNFTIWANDTEGNTNQTDTQHFTLKFYGKTRIETDYPSYDPNTLVKLKSVFSDWWNPTFLYRKNITVSETSGTSRNNAPVNITIHFPPGHAYNGSLRLVNSSGTTHPYYIQDYSLNGNFYTAATIFFNATVQANSQETYYLYYTNDSVGYVSYSEITGNTQGLTVTEKPEDYMGSSILNRNETSTYGYLIMKVQRYQSPGWTDVDTVVNDLETGNPRLINPYNFTLLDTVWNEWNTDRYENGTYRIYVAFTDPQGNVLETSDSSFIQTFYNFTINPPPSIIAIKNITIYDVTDSPNTHTDTSNLQDSGLNKTFLLYTEKVYRIEILVENSPNSEENWTISDAQVYHLNLSQSWVVSSSDIWYSNGTNFEGGSFTGGNVSWDTTQDGIVPKGETATFYYVVNVTSTSEEFWNVDFWINDTNFIKHDYSVFHVVVSEEQPPQLFNNTYGLNTTHVNRGGSMLIYANWTEDIGWAKAEYNDTSSQLVNHTITPEGTWTNHTIQTNSSWLLGHHIAKIYAADLNQNWNNSLKYLDFWVWGWAHVEDSHPQTSQTIQENESITFYCEIRNDASLAIDQYPVDFWIDNVYQGTNLTNSSGWAFFNFTSLSLGTHTLKCNISDNSSLYYNITSQNYATLQVTVRENNPPLYSQISQNKSLAYKGDSVLLSAYWTDDYQLNQSILETNETGSFQNSSLANPINLSYQSQAYSNFSVQLPLDMTPGTLAWR
ncbi:MAG: hypothetical protein DRP18_04460, partial [Candidatus Aenigmatarchaeota archaeon]